MFLPEKMSAHPSSPPSLVYIHTYLYIYMASQVVLVVKNLPANAGDIRDAGLIPGLERSPGGRNGNPFQYSSPGNPMDRRGRWATVHGAGHQESDSTEQMNIIYIYIIYKGNFIYIFPHFVYPLWHKWKWGPDMQHRRVGEPRASNPAACSRPLGRLQSPCLDFTCLSTHFRGRWYRIFFL